MPMQFTQVSVVGETATLVWGASPLSHEWERQEILSSRGVDYSAEADRTLSSRLFYMPPVEVQSGDQSLVGRRDR